jgi:hypothetical protein
MRKALEPGLLILLLTAWFLLAGTKPGCAQSKIKATAFQYQPDLSEDKYNQRIKQKTLPLDDARFIILNRKAEHAYSLTCYQSDLKKTWEVALPLAENEALEAFSHNGHSALVLTHRSPAGSGIQSIYGTLIDLQTGRKSPSQQLFEAPASSRRIGTALSPDGNKLVTFQYINQQDQLQAIAATVFDGNLSKIKDHTYHLRDLRGIQSANVRIDNTGNQYLSLITNKATRLSVRRYTNTEAEVKAMDLQIGGMFDGRQVYIFDTFFAVQANNQVYAAAICADDKTGEYHSLKVVRFDFGAGDMKFAPEFVFSPQYLTQVNAQAKTGSPPAKRLEDIYLTDLILSAEMDLLVVAEKKYQEGPSEPFVAREMHLFAYDNFLNPTWHSLVNKHQTATTQEGFSGISYKGRIFHNHFHLLTLEKLNGKTDLLTRKINLKTGISAAPTPLGLQVSSQENLAYLKDFTAWLNEKNILAVVKPAKKSSALELRKVTRK